VSLRVAGKSLDRKPASELILPVDVVKKLTKRQALKVKLKPRRYFSLIVVAREDATEIWLGDKQGHFVKKAVGCLDIWLLPGEYVLSFGLHAPTFSLLLTRSMRRTQSRIETQSICPRPIPQID
jgi:hypothetical protein